MKKLHPVQLACFSLATMLAASLLDGVLMSAGWYFLSGCICSALHRHTDWSKLSTGDTNG